MQLVNAKCETRWGFSVVVHLLICAVGLMGEEVGSCLMVEADSVAWPCCAPAVVLGADLAVEGTPALGAAEALALDLLADTAAVGESDEGAEETGDVAATGNDGVDGRPALRGTELEEPELVVAVGK